jgi:hypothetical protein
MKTIGSLRTIAAGHAFVQNLRRRHYELALDVRAASVSERPSTNLPVRSSRPRKIGHQAALRPLANRLVGILHGSLKTRTLYDESIA